MDTSEKTAATIHRHLNPLQKSVSFFRTQIRRYLFITELALLGLLLVLCGYAYPDRIRTALWTEGGTQGWNSDPTLRIYFYANYQTPPSIPYIWSWK